MPVTIQIGPWTVEAEPSRTRACYERIEQGSPEACGCPNCGTFAGSRAEAYPPEAMALLSELGVDSCKEEGVFDVGHSEGGRRMYLGVFFACGRILSGPMAPARRAEMFSVPETFKVRLTSGGWRSDQFPEGGGIQLEFCTEIAGPA